MTILYRIYQWLIAAPILLILTAITALTTIIGTAFGKRSFRGYWPAHFTVKMRLLFMVGESKGGWP